MAQIKAGRDKNESRNWRCSELRFFKGGWRTEHRRASTYQPAVSMPEVLDRSLSVQGGHEAWPNSCAGHKRP